MPTQIPSHARDETNGELDISIYLYCADTEHNAFVDENEYFTEEIGTSGLDAAHRVNTMSTSDIVSPSIDATHSSDTVHATNADLFEVAISWPSLV